MRRLLFALCLLVAGLPVWADDGMWQINAIDAALAKQMKARGLKLSPKEIYNADAEGAVLSDAVVSLEFGCTGSIISDEGLLITNHHCAYSDIHSLSTMEHNYLEEGFWAFRQQEERNIPGKRVLFLKKVIDVTEETREEIRKAEAEGRHLGSRKLSYVMEHKYGTDDLEAYFSSMWKGEKYYIALYEVYSDVRLVAAPPVSMAAFGGDIDNWEWPQHKCDFAMYRVYTAPDGSPAEYSSENVPLKPDAKLDISLEGYKPGDYTMVIGYPGRTNRYISSYSLDMDLNFKLPVSNRIRGEQIAILNNLMNKNPEVRLKYADYYFSLTNVQELNEGQVQCCRRFGTVANKRAEEKLLQDWIDSNPERKAKWGDLLENLRSVTDAIGEVERNKVIFRETVFRGCNLSRFAMRIHSSGRGNKEVCRKRLQSALERCAIESAAYDMAVEKELFLYSFVEYMTEMDPRYFGEFHTEIAEEASMSESNRKNPQTIERLRKIAENIWDSSCITTLSPTDSLTCQCEETFYNDPFVRFITDCSITVFNDDCIRREKNRPLLNLEREYTHALYEMRLDKGIPQYPDANSTMRITYGTVGDIVPYDAIRRSWRSTSKGILEKYNPESYEFTLNDRQLELYSAGDWGRYGTQPWIKTASGKWKQDKKAIPEMYINFLTDNDITGGNSGSPVLNARGELIGLAFDGNKESLASDAEYNDGYNKCVCVDIRYILWTLDRYAGMTRILNELGL